MTQGKKMLVVSAHAIDYAWRSGDTIAKYIKSGADVHVVVLSFDMRGESNDLWKQEGTTVGSMKEARRKEAMEATTILGIQDIEFRDLPDYPMAPALMPEVQECLTRKIHEVRPDIILTHDKNGENVLNLDHNVIGQFVLECNIQNSSNGMRTERTQMTKQMRLYGFEPHQTELNKFTPGSSIDIMETYEQKVAAMKRFKARGHLTEYHTERIFLRGSHIRRISGNQTYKYVECSFSSLPTAGEGLY